MKSLRHLGSSMVVLCCLAGVTKVLPNSITVTPTSITGPFSDTTVSVTMTVYNESALFKLHWTDWHLSIYDDDPWPNPDDWLMNAKGDIDPEIVIQPRTSASTTVQVTIPKARLESAGETTLELIATFYPTGWLDRDRDDERDPGETLPESGPGAVLFLAVLGLALWRSSS